MKYATHEHFGEPKEMLTPCVTIRKYSFIYK